MTDLSGEVVPGDLVPAATAAPSARVTPRTLGRWITSGRIPGWRIGRRWFVSAAQLDDYLAAGRGPRVL